jgi:adenylosuccinate lyase
VKEIELTTNHDVKAVEYFLKEKFAAQGQQMDNLKEYLHFSCTSEDINNLSYSLMLKDSMKDVILPKLRSLHQNLEQLATDHADVPMMCRTHGQSATPSTLGKELANFSFRLNRQIVRLE